jgi:hypothetical protein
MYKGLIISGGFLFVALVAFGLCEANPMGPCASAGQAAELLLFIGSFLAGSVTLTGWVVWRGWRWFHGDGFLRQTTARIPISLFREK